MRIATYKNGMGNGTATSAHPTTEEMLEESETTHPNRNRHESLRPPIRLPEPGISSDQHRISWFTRPIPTSFGGIAGYVLDKGGKLFAAFPALMYLIYWSYLLRVRPAVEEFEAVAKFAEKQLAERAEQVRVEREQLTATIEQLRNHRAQCEADESSGKLEFAELLAAAHLPWSGEDPISVQAVEMALLDATPDSDEFSGLNHLVPTQDDNRSVPRQGPKSVNQMIEILGQWMRTSFLALILPIACGVLMGFCVGELSNLLSINRLRNGEQHETFLLLAITGTAIVYAIGSIFSTAVWSFSLSRELRHPTNAEAEPVPALQEGVISYVWLLVSLISIIAELCVEAVGLQRMNQSMVEMAMHSNMGSAQVLSFPVYMLLAIAFSASYFLYKGISTWIKARESQREVWLHSLERRWLKDKRKCKEVRQARVVAAKVEDLGKQITRATADLEQLENRLAGLEDKIQLDAATKQRYVVAEIAAVGESSRLYHLIEDLVHVADGRRPQGSPESIFPFFGTDMPKKEE